MNLERKRIDKIFTQINKIGTKGKDNTMEYYKYIDDMVIRGDYDNLLQCLYYYYDVDTQNFNTVEEIKKKTWKEVVFRSKSAFDYKLKKLYDVRGVYQTSFNIFKDDNTFLGELKEIYLYTDETKYYIKNKQYGKVTGTRKSFIEVTKVSEDGNIYATSSVMITENNPAFPEDQNLYNRYVLALDMLLL